MKITVLGCGSTYGVPVAGGDWGSCDPLNAKNRRLRPSVFIENEGSKILIDIGPDFKEQTEKHRLRDLDAILITHGHADHMLGLFELPRYMQSMTKDLTIYTDAATLQGIKRMFYYLFESEDNVTYYGDHRMIWKTIAAYDSFMIGNTHLQAMDQDHDYMRSLGFRIGNFAYNSDLANMPEKSFSLLQNLDVWIVDCDNHEPSSSHNHTDQLLQWVERLHPKSTFLTHLDEEMDYDALCRTLPSHIRPAYDGLEIEIPVRSPPTF